jgi:hypothetical protein
MQALVSLVLTLAAVRVFDAQNYGWYMVLWGLVEITRPLGGLGLLPALQQFLPEMAIGASRGQLVRFVAWIMWLQYVISLICMLLLVFFWAMLGRWLGFPVEQGNLGWLAGLIILTVQGAEFTAHGLEALLDQKSAQFTRALFPTLRLFGLAILTSLGSVGLQSVLFIDLVSAAICVVVATVALLQRLESLRPNGTRQFTFSEIRTFIWHMSGVQMLNAISSPGSVRILVAKVLGPELTGQFSFLQQLIAQAARMMPSILLADMVRPILISRRVKDESSSSAVTSGILWKANIALIWPGVALMLVAGDAVISLLSGGRIAHGGTSMVWMMLSLTSMAQSQIVTLLMQIHRHTAALRSVSLTALLIPLCAWGGAWYGLQMAAVGVAIATWVRGTLGLLVLHRRGLDLAADTSGVLRLFSALVVSTLLGWTFGTWFGQWVAGSVFLATFVIGVLLAQPLESIESELIQQVLGVRRAHFLRFFVYKRDR